MNILFYIDFPFELHKGGVQRSTHKMAHLFERKGHNCVILAKTENNEVDEVDGLIILPLNDRKSAVSINQYKAYLNEYSIDVVINQMGSDHKVTDFLYKHKSKNIRLLSTLRMNPKSFADNLIDILEVKLRKRRGIKFLNNYWIRQFILAYHRVKQSHILSLIIKKSDYFILLNRNFIPELKYFGIDTQKHSSKLKAIPNLFSPIQNHNTSKKNIILFVGRLSRNQKRTDLLLEIWRQLHTCLKDWEFLVVGDGHDRKWMLSYIDRYNLNRIKLLGYQNPEPYYQKAKILSFTSAYEGFGNVLVEAQQHGVVPVMFNSYSAAADIVIDKVSGFLVEPFDCDRFIHKTAILANNESLHAKMAINALHQAKKFEEEEVYKSWKTLLEK